MRGEAVQAMASPPPGWPGPTTRHGQQPPRRSMSSSENGAPVATSLPWSADRNVTPDALLAAIKEVRARNRADLERS